MLTATRQSKTGYWIDALKKNLYSIEEINYFLYNHIDLVYRDFFSEKLFSYIENELDQPLMAGDLRNLNARGAGTAEFVKYILNESYYYNSQELADISALVAGIDTMTSVQRLKIQGDTASKNGNLNSALKCYLEILRRIPDGEEQDSFYAQTAYSIGTIYAAMFMCKSATAFFTYAYELYPDMLYSRACVYMSIISGDDEELLSSIVRFKISDDQLDAIKARISAMRRELENSPDAVEFARNIKSPEFADAILEQWKSGYYDMLK